MTPLQIALAMLEIDQKLRFANTPDQQRDAMLFTAKLTLECRADEPSPLSERSKDIVEHQGDFK